MSNQLVKKNPAEGYQNIFPKTWIDAIKDKESGVSLQEILQGFNMYFLSYNGSRALTRCKVPSVLRKEGLWITYVLYDHTVVTEWYNSDQIDDNSWSMDSNWRVASNNLVGDVSISADGYWVINGEKTEAKAQGEQGVTPLLRVGANSKLQVSYNAGKAWKDISDYIIPRFRWNQGVGTTAGTIQISMDLGNTWTNLSNEITNNLRISRYIGINESLPTSGVAEGTIYMKGPYYDESDTSHTNPIYRMWIYAWKGNTLAWQDNGEFTSISARVVQERGNSTAEVMSQDAVTKELTELESKNSQLGQDIGEYVFKLSKLSDLTQFVGTGVSLTPIETKQGYYNVQTKQWIPDSTFTFKIYSVQDGKYYDVLNKLSASIAASIVLFKNNEPIYIGRYADNSHILLVATGYDKIGLNYPSSALTEYNTISLVIPENGITTDAIANDAVTTVKLASSVVTNDKIQNDTIAIEKIAFKTVIEGANRANPAACVYAKYINYNDGVAYSTGTSTPSLIRYVTDFIPVSQNGLYCNGLQPYGSVGYGAVYDSAKRYLRGQSTKDYTYQDGDGYVRWTVSVDSVETPNLYVIEGTQEGSYTPYVTPKQVIKKEYIPKLDSSNIEDGAITSEKIASDATIPTMFPALSLCGKDCIKATAASIASSGTLQITAFPQYLKANGIVSFSGKLSSFNDISVGFGTSTNNIQVKVDATNIYFIKSGQQLGSAVEHGLTISDFINVTFDNDFFHPKVIISTLSGIFVHDRGEFNSLESYGYPVAVMGTGTSVTDAELRATSDKFNKPIWVVGDSYTSLYDERWTKQMIKSIGIDDFLIIGLAGGGSGDMYADLQKALVFGTPKFLIWCLGMNDSYDAWSVKFKLLKSLCASIGVELILQTIPIPNLDTSSRQVAINAAIRESGYRYIDACAAMCPNNTYPWYEGYCADGVHPTVLGAKVLAARFLSDFPEFMH